MPEKGPVDWSVGQFRATEICPICGGDNGDGKWTCPECTALVNVHRELLRNLQQWRSMYESGDITEVLVANDRREYCLWDVDAFYAARLILPPRQSMSIQFCLYENMKERDAASRMGIKPSNPVSIYATIGLTSLLLKASTGEIDGYFVEVSSPVVKPILAAPPIIGRISRPKAHKELVS